MKPWSLTVLLLSALVAPLARAQALPDTLLGFLQGVAVEAAQHAGSSRVVLRVLPDAAPHAVTQVFAEQLQLRQVEVVGMSADGASGADPVLSVELRELRTFTASLGDSAYLVRSRASLGAFLRQPATGAIPWSRSFALDVEHTAVSPAEPVDCDWLAAPDTSWTERWGGPLIITASALIIAVLLFTVRGS